MMIRNPILALCLGLLAPLAMAAESRPNILLLMADDLGYSDIGALGGEIDTPHIDGLVRDGRLLLDFHSAPSCSPTRAMLMTGNDQHLSGLGMMAEVRKRLYPEVPAERIRPGYEGELRGDAVTVAELLRDGGYHTLLAGKWHLGMEPEQGPDRLGFEQSHVVLEGGSAHFKQAEMGLMANYSSTFLHNGEPMALPDDFYSTTFFTDRLIEGIDAAGQAGRPFFAFAAYTAPHWPLQAPDALLQKYRGHYDEGYQAVADRRLARLKALGLLGEDYPERAWLEGVPAWESLSREQQQRSARKMEAYAAMVEAMDREIGRLLDHLKATGAYDNTLILFTSDNGPESVDREQPIQDWVNRHFDNSLDNLGRANSFIAYGKAWAQVSAQPFRGFKQGILEGGIRVPLVAHFPARVEAGISRELASMRDIMPTLLELAGVELPGIEYRGRPTLPVQGSSLLAHLSDAARPASPASAGLGWEVDGSAAIRRGSMKLVHAPRQLGAGWRLFDLAADPGERHDLATERQELVTTMLADWRHYAQLNNIALDADLTPATPVREAPGQRVAAQ